MKTVFMRVLKISGLMVLVAGILCGCDGGGGDDPQPADVRMTGLWEGFIMGDDNIVANLRLRQTDTKVLGDWVGDPLAGRVSTDPYAFISTITNTVDSEVRFLEVQGNVDSNFVVLTSTITTPPPESETLVMTLMGTVQSNVYSGEMTLTLPDLDPLLERWITVLRFTGTLVYHRTVTRLQQPVLTFYFEKAGN
jgi:hypothetical protein